MTSAQRVQYETQGFLHIPGALDPETTRKLGAAFDAAAQKYSDQWKPMADAPGSLPKFFDIPRILDEDDVFVDLTDFPSVFSVLLGIIGGDIQLVQVQARLFPPGRTFTAPWHSDLAEINGIDLGNSLNFMVKVHFYPYDLLPGQGCLAFIPGSHRYPPGYPHGVQINPEHESSVFKKIIPRAGDAVLFNTHVLHMALDNTSTDVRKSLIYSYSHFWVKNYPSAVPRDLERVATTPQRKQLFGIPSSHRDGAYFYQTFLAPNLRTEARSFLYAGRKLASRARDLYFARR
jgi:phytanoyl-CoA hydroxylase